MIEGISQRNYLFLNAYYNRDIPSKDYSEPGGFQTRFSSYKDFPKADPPMSEEDFEKAIYELGKKEYANGLAASGEPSKERRRLLLSYISVVSPDRDKIISNTLKKIPFHLRGAKLGYSEFFNTKGENVAKYSPNVGWSEVLTNDEATRTSKFYSLFIAGINDAMIDEKNNVNTQASISGIAIDTKA